MVTVSEKLLQNIMQEAIRQNRNLDDQSDHLKAIRRDVRATEKAVYFMEQRQDQAAMTKADMVRCFVFCLQWQTDCSFLCGCLLGFVFSQCFCPLRFVFSQCSCS